MNKTFLTNLIAILFILISFFLPENFSQVILYTGLFALSGSITNELAILMIFKKIPYLYGSGVIEKNFEPFKVSIKKMVLTQFFNKEKLDLFFESELKDIDFKPIIKKIDFEKIVNSIEEDILDTSFGGVISFIGVDSVLSSLKKPLERSIKKTVKSIVASETFTSQINDYIENASFSEDLIEKVNGLVDARLNDLTPLMVKNLIEGLIKEHLSWLVVWGGVFGGLIGFVSTLVMI